MSSKPYIGWFKGPYEFLRNFYPSRIVSYDPWNYMREFATVEHAYQASKTLDTEWYARIREAGSPGEAKALGQCAPLREDWDDIKLAVMHDLLKKKFADKTLALGLIATGDAQLVEGNHWGDRFWGVDSYGENWLGRLLMLVRSELRLVAP